MAFAMMVFSMASCQKDVEEFDVRLDWVGSWTCNEVTGNFAPQVYQVEISEYGSGDQVSVTGLYGQGNQFVVYANVTSKSITIPFQTVDAINISGSGTINNDLDYITFTLTVNDGSGNDNVSGFMER